MFGAQNTQANRRSRRELSVIFMVKLGASGFHRRLPVDGILGACLPKLGQPAASWGGKARAEGPKGSAKAPMPKKQSHQGTTI